MPIEGPARERLGAESRAEGWQRWEESGGP